MLTADRLPKLRLLSASAAPALTSLALFILCALPARRASAAEILELVPAPVPLAISFTLLLLLIYPVNRLLLQPLATILERRADLTRGATERAEAEVSTSQELRAQLDERLAAARADAQAARAASLAKAEAAERDLLTRARDEANQAIERIRTEVAEDVNRTRDALPGLAGDLARDAASRLLGRAL